MAEPAPADPRAYATVTHDGQTDQVAVEEPLEIRVDDRPLTVTMRTPGHDDELALGFLYGEGLIEDARDTGPGPDLAANTVDVAGPLLRDPGERRFYTSSSCGVCGKGALEEVAVQSQPLGTGPQVPRLLLARLSDRLAQPAFERTGGLHATRLFDAVGALLLSREDVGRHNAMDKVSADPCSTGCYRSPSVSSASADGSRSSWSRRRLSPAARSWSGSGRRAASRSSWPPTAA